MSLGAPVVTSNASCLPEIAGGAAILVDPESTVSIAEGLKRALTELPTAREERIEAGKQVAARFPWSEPGKLYLQLVRPARVKVLLVAEPGVDGVFRHVEGLCRFLFSRDVAVHLAYSSERGSDSLRRLVDEVRARGGETLDLRVGPCARPAPTCERLSNYVDWRA